MNARRGSRWLGLAVAFGVALGIGCGHRQARSPTRLRDAHVQALRADDPAAAYALLAPEVQATVSFEEFEARWKSDSAEHAQAIAAAESLDPALQDPLHGGTTVHPGGRVLHWTQVDDALQITDGLPGRLDTSTPAQAVRAFIAAVRRADLAELRSLMHEPLLAALEEDWSTRVDAIERALEEPGALELSADLHRAELRYEGSRVLTLEQTPAGWRITGLR
ncbi:hypothetical protein [Paraliomyxa miuraensis]|uniref:hypothetical protein n=1 Tax=Paraliomyxa miuraensis TaxID=376150 RepID=UPI00224EB800|nr:hypothetical protein [Paraliomyxa miuraensis]MCX4245508.1 hypothetical protein [Paraliomyxa miuraensis]